MKKDYQCVYPKLAELDNPEFMFSFSCGIVFCLFSKSCCDLSNNTKRLNSNNYKRKRITDMKLDERTRPFTLHCLWPWLILIELGGPRRLMTYFDILYHVWSYGGWSLSHMWEQTFRGIRPSVLNNAGYSQFMMLVKYICISFVFTFDCVLCVAMYCDLYFKTFVDEAYLPYKVNI